MSEKVHQVVVVGAGVAGLAAAKFLRRHGIADIFILEGNLFKDLFNENCKNSFFNSKKQTWWKNREL
jgi:thioredoxin reductase